MEKNFVSDIVAYQRLKEKIDADLAKKTTPNGVKNYDSITKADVIKERHKILTEQNKKNDEAVEAAPIEESSALNVLGTATQPPEKTLKANGMAVEKTKAENKKNTEEAKDKDKDKKDNNENNNTDNKSKDNKEDNSETKPEVDTPAQSNNSNTPSEKVNEEE